MGLIIIFIVILFIALIIFGFEMKMSEGFYVSGFIGGIAIVVILICLISIPTQQYSGRKFASQFEVNRQLVCSDKASDPEMKGFIWTEHNRVRTEYNTRINDHKRLHNSFWVGAYHSKDIANLEYLDFTKSCEIKENNL